ncbi:hypothetical protein ACNOYE_07460 [Nannocystaceae bacterium ST9]
MRPRPSERKPIRDPSRRQRFASLRAALIGTAVGRDFDLARLRTIADFQAWVPLLDAEAHAARVTTKLGFDLAELPEAELGAGERDRPELIDIWRQRLRASEHARTPAARPRRIALLHAADDDPLIDRLRLDDLRALAPELELLRLTRLDADPRAQLAELVRFRPDTLVLPSLATCSWLEGALRMPIERHLEGLRWLFAEADLDQRIRSRLPVINAGWLHVAGRIGLPTRRNPWQGFSLATRSLLIELLPHGDPEVDPRARVDDRPTVLPENAVLGERYELILSSPLGFLRLRSGLHVRVVGFVPPPHPSGASEEDSLLRPRVLRLPPPPADLSLEGVTLAGAWLTSSVRQAFTREDPALVAGEIMADHQTDPRDRTARGLEPFVDTELGASRAGARARGPKPRALVVRVEVQGQTDSAFAPRLARRIDDDLRNRSAAYEWLRGRGDLWEVRVVVAEAGTARRARDRRIRALVGTVERPAVRVRTDF